MAVDFFDLALWAAAALYIRAMAPWGRAWWQLHQSLQSPYRESVEVVDEAPTAAVERMRPLVDLLTEYGFAFVRYVKHHGLGHSRYESIHFDESGKWTGGAVDAAGDLPPALELDAWFEDGTMLIVTSPYGERVDASKFHARHAYDPQAALAYFHQKVREMEAVHGPARHLADKATNVSMMEYYHQNFRRLYHSRQYGYLSTQLLLYLVIIATLIGWPILRIQLEMNALPMAMAVSAVCLALHGLIIARYYRYRRFSGALDESINPPPVIGTAGRKKKKS
ncbi:MAG: hypothetical protein SNJ83_06925 [Aggregatilineales bacterium]